METGTAPSHIVCSRNHRNFQSNPRSHDILGARPNGHLYLPRIHSGFICNPSHVVDEGYRASDADLSLEHSQFNHFATWYPRQPPAMGRLAWATDLSCQ